MALLQALASQLANHATLSHSLLIPLEASVNQLLKQDPVALQHIAAEAGRLVCIKVNDIQPLYIRLLDQGVAFSFRNEARPDVIMRGSLADFKALARAGDKANQLINSAIDMDGDSELSIRLTRLVQQLDIDWEALIQPLTGSLLAHQLGKSVRGLFRWGKSSASTYRVAAKDYLEDEAQLVTPQPLLDQFADEVDELRFASDRLQARLDQLQARQQASDDPQH